MLTSPNITEMIVAWRGGDQAARDSLIEVVYDELYRLAEIYLRHERGDHTLQPTALVNEAYLKLFDGGDADVQNRAHLFGLAARAMRQILVDHARARLRDKRGGKQQYRLSITTADKFIRETDVDLIDLDEALDRLAALDERKSRIVELRFFGGLTVNEIADALDLSPTTIEREWRFAKAWLRRELSK